MADGTGPLAGVRTIELTSGLAGSYAGYLLAGLGADVVRVDAGATPETPAQRVVNRGKRSVALDIDVATLARGVDAIVVDEAARAVPRAAHAVTCRVSAWGGDGDPADEALVAAVTGCQAMQWSWSRRPVWLVTPMISYMTGMLAALGVTAALFARRRGAPAQALAVRALDGAFALNSGTYVTGSETRGSLSQFGDPRGQIATYAFFRTADGWIFIGALTPAFLVKLMTVLDRVELLADPRLQGSPLAFGVPEIKELVRRELDPLLAARPTAEWMRLLRDADLPCGAVRNREAAVADPDARALGLVVPMDDPVVGPTWQPGAPAGFSDTPAPAPRPAPLRGADTAAVRAEASTWRITVPPPAATPPRSCLEGIRVLDLTSFIAGPFCPMLLADLGADVVKIESADGDPFRMAAFGFVGWNRGKRSLVVDLKRPEGRDVLLDLAQRADVVVDNFRAGVMDRLGIGWDALRLANPRLIHTSITGYGSDGPLATLPGFDPIFQAQSGLAQAQGGDDDPVFHLIAYNDYTAGTLGALATVAALFARERTGRGQRVDVSLFRTSYVAQAAHLTEWPRGGRDHQGPSACRRIYACRDGSVCIAATTEAHVEALAGLAGVPIRRDDPADGAAADAVARVLERGTRADAIERLTTAGIPSAPCRTFEELFTDELLRAKGCVVEQQHPTLGRLLMSGPFIQFEATPVVFERSAPLLGADGREVLAEIGYAPDRIDALVAAGVVGATS